MKHYAVLHDPQQGYQCLLRTWELVKPWLVSGHKLELRISPPKRTLDQNALIHPLVGKIARAANRATDEESLRVLRWLFVEQWRSETGRPPLYEKSLDGLRLVNVTSGTSELDKPDCSEFIDWLYAWAAHHGIDVEQD
jgi:ribosomal protein L30/L7E